MIALAAAVGTILCFLSFISLVVFVLFPRDRFGFLVVAIILGISGVVVWRVAIQWGRDEK